MLQFSLVPDPRFRKGSGPITGARLVSLASFPSRSRLQFLIVFAYCKHQKLEAGTAWERGYGEL